MRRRFPTRPLVLALAVILVLTIGLKLLGPDDDYEVAVLVPQADGMFVGAEATMNGRSVGRISDISVQDNAARLTVSMDGGAGPLHAGTQAHITWNSLVGRRQLELLPGPVTNPELPDGQLIESAYERVELDDIVAALDAPTRAKVKKTVAELEKTLDGNEKNLNTTLATAGPFVDALGGVLKSVGEDGPAIRDLLTQLRGVTSVLAGRDTEMAATIQNLSQLVAETSKQQNSLRDALGEAPTTLAAATDFFETVPSAVDKTVPVLEGLQPATAELPGLARKLDPILTDLRPTVAELRPTLAAADELLDQAPGLLNLGSEVLPDVDQALDSLQPAIAFLRPYTPEVIGFLTNWTSLFSAKNSSGHFGRALVPAGATSFNSNPGVLPPGVQQSKRPAPGALVDQPWTDANGDGIR